MHIDQIIDYLHCPYKVKYSESSSIRTSDIEQIRTIAISSLAKSYLFSVYENKTMTVGNLRRQLNLVWNKLITTIPFEYEWTDLAKLEDQCKRLPALFPATNSLVAVNYPVSLEINKAQVTGTIDAIIRRADCVELIIFDTSSTVSSKIELAIKANYYLTACKQEIKYSKVPIKISFFKIVNGVLKNVDFNQKIDWKSILSNVLKSEGIYYPRLTNDICKSCLFKKSCEWII